MTLFALALAGCRTTRPVQRTESPARPLIEHGSMELNSTSAPVPNPSDHNALTLIAHEEEQADTTDEPGGLSLFEAEGLAFQNNPTLSAAAARMNAAQGKQVQAGLYPNPVIGYHATEIGNLGTPGQQGGFVSQRFITGGKLALDQAIAAKEIDERQFQFHAQEQRILSDVRVRFYEALVAQQRVQLSQKLAAIGDELVEATETLLEGRLGTENDLLQAQIRADEAQILLDNARNQSSEAWKRLVAVLGLPNMQERNLDGLQDADLPVMSWEDSYSSALDNHPELNAARTRIDRASITIQRARREPIPNIDLWVSARHHYVSGGDVANVQLGVPIPIFNRNQGNIRTAEAEWIEACNDAKRMELDLQDRLAVTFRRYQNARQQVDRYLERMIPLAEKSLKLVMEGYESGQVDYLTLLTAQQTYLQVSLAYLDSLAEIWASSSIIQGQLLTGSLRTDN